MIDFDTNAIRQTAGEAMQFDAGRESDARTISELRIIIDEQARALEIGMEMVAAIRSGNNQRAAAKMFEFWGMAEDALKHAPASRGA